MKLIVNNITHDISAPPDMPLLWILRDKLGLTGTKYGCGEGVCGACVVCIDGRQEHACQVTLDQIAGKTVVTIEGQNGRIAEALFAAWDEVGVTQCGFCQPGQINSACTLLAVSQSPSNEDIDIAMRGNICRCGTYPRIRQAIHRAAEMLAGQAKEAQ